MRLNILSIIISIISFASSLFAQYGSIGSVDARSTGMAKTSTAISRGVYALGINPANLAYYQDKQFNISTLLPIPHLSVKSGTDFISLNDVNYFFGGVNGSARLLTETDKQRLDDLFKGGGNALFNTSFNLLSFSYSGGASVGAFGFSINDFLSGKINFPQAAANIALYGNPRGKLYNFSDAGVKAWWLRNYSFSYARQLLETKSGIFNKLFAGVTLKLVSGYAYVTTDRNVSTFQTGNSNEINGAVDARILSSFSDNFGVKYDFDSVSHNSNISPFPSPAGLGFGIDIGVSASISKEWNFSLAVTDIGNINWNKNTAEFIANGSFYIDDLVNKEQIDSIKDDINYKSKSTSSFISSLPTALRIGASYYYSNLNSAFPGSLLLSLDINQGFNDQPGNSKNTRVSVGAEWKPMDWVPYIRTGFSFGGVLGFHWAAGFGFDAGVVEFNIATFDLQTLITNSGKSLSLAFDSRWKF